MLLTIKIQAQEDFAIRWRDDNSIQTTWDNIRQCFPRTSVVFHCYKRKPLHPEFRLSNPVNGQYICKNLTHSRRLLIKMQSLGSKYCTGCSLFSRIVDAIQTTYNHATRSVLVVTFLLWTCILTWDSQDTTLRGQIQILKYIQLILHWILGSLNVSFCDFFCSLKRWIVQKVYCVYASQCGHIGWYKCRI